MAEGPPRRRPARPVADAPVGCLLPRVDDLTKGWLLALVEQAPLEEVPSILAAEVAQDGPRLCETMVRALASDDDLRALEPGGALEQLVAGVGIWSGAQRVESISSAVEALGSVIWSGVREALVRPDADQVAELAARLARVVELVRVAALRRYEGRDPQADHQDSATISRSDSRGCGSGARGRDPEWIGVLDEELSRSRRTGAPLSLLVVELEDAERVLAAEGAQLAARTFRHFARALRGATRRQDVLLCESDARGWVIAPDTARSGARGLGERIISAVREVQSGRGAPLTVNVGVAVFGEDSRNGDDLIEAAEQAMFAAAASGSGIAEGDGGGEAPWEPGPELVR